MNAQDSIVWFYIPTNSGFPGTFANSCCWRDLSVLLVTAFLCISIKGKNAGCLWCVHFPSSHSLGIAKKYNCWFRKFLADVRRYYKSFFQMYSSQVFPPSFHLNFLDMSFSKKKVFFWSKVLSVSFLLAVHICAIWEVWKLAPHSTVHRLCWTSFLNHF